MQYLSDKARTIAPYTAGEQPAGRTFVKLNTNENPYPPAPAVAAALAGFSTENLRRYPEPDSGMLRAAIAAAEGARPENIFCGNGSDEVLALCFPAFFNPREGEGACFADITYSFYQVFAAFFGIPATTVPLNADFSFDFEAFRAVKCRGFFLANPNAPTGVGVPREEMRSFLSSVGERLVIADEAYMDFYGQSCVPLTKEFDNLLVVKTFSKSYALAGIRCGYAVGAKDLIDGLFRMKDCFNSYPVDMVCRDVCIAALSEREYYRRTISLVCAERERVREALLGMGFTVPESRANFLFAGRAKVSGKTLYERLKAAGVLVRFWDVPVLRDFCRITVGTKEDNDSLLKEIADILA